MTDIEQALDCVICDGNLSCPYGTDHRDAIIKAYRDSQAEVKEVRAMIEGYGPMIQNIEKLKAEIKELKEKINSQEFRKQCADTPLMVQKLSLIRELEAQLNETRETMGWANERIVTLERALKIIANSPRGQCEGFRCRDVAKQVLSGGNHE